MASSRTKKDGFQKKYLNHSITFLQKSSDQRDAQLFHYFGYKKSIQKFQIYQNRAFRLNKAHNLKPYIGSSADRDQKLQCVEDINILPIKYTVVKIIFKANL